MFKLLRNKKGIFGMDDAIFVLLVVMGTTLTHMYIATKSPLIKRNQDRIWCKMRNQGQAYCDAQYPPLNP